MDSEMVGHDDVDDCTKRKAIENPAILYHSNATLPRELDTSVCYGEALLLKFFVLIGLSVLSILHRKEQAD